MISSPDGPPLSGTRRAYVDWARGVAVLVMIEAHVLDAWTLVTERGTRLFAYLNILGGFAAPLFLWLAGLSLVLSAERAAARTGDRRAAAKKVLLRGVQIFALAFLFRLQAFIVSPGNPLVSLLRVDILNIMGPAMMLTALLWRLSRGPRIAAIVLGGAAATIALVTPPVRAAAWLADLPQLAQWYISPSGRHSTFTLFPWAGFVFAGAAFGSLLGLAAAGREARAIFRLTLAGAAIAAACYGAAMLPAVYASSSYWTSSPTYFGVRVGVMMVTFGLLFAATPLSPHVPAAFGVLERLGRHSLFVYWIHVELVYGYATAVIHRRLPIWAASLAFVVFCVALYWSIALRDRVLTLWRSRSRVDRMVESAGV